VRIEKIHARQLEVGDYLAGYVDPLFLLLNEALRITSIHDHKSNSPMGDARFPRSGDRELRSMWPNQQLLVIRLTPEPDALFTITVADVEADLERPLREGEAERISAALHHSTIPVSMSTVLDAFRDNEAE
jgi:hypothetical protein